MGDFSPVARVFRRTDAILGESLFFDGRGAMFWCDITAGLVHRSPVWKNPGKMAPNLWDNPHLRSNRVLV